MGALLVWVTMLVGFLALPVSTASGREVSVPLQLAHELLRQTMLERTFTGPEHTLRVWDDGEDCSHLDLSDPRVDTDAGQIRVRTASAGRVGTTIGGRCLSFLDLTGSIEVLQEPVADPAEPIVRFQVTESHFRRSDGSKPFIGIVWDWVEPYVRPHLEATSVDLEDAFEELGDVLEVVLPRSDHAQTEALIDSLLLTHVRANEQGLAARIRFDVPELPAATEPPVPEATLSAAELEQFERAWQQWDAFVTFVVKRAAHDAQAAELRAALFNVLLEARYDILAALATTTTESTDVVRTLFVQTWSRLAPVLRRLHTGLPGEQALRYLTFIAAADALQAMEELGPAMGLELSADGLRRLARTLAPRAAEDPLTYDLAVDPELRELFGFGPPLPPPTENPDLDQSWWFGSSAWAASDPADLAPRLNSWVPTREEVPEYLPMVRDLLNGTGARTLDAKPLGQDFHQTYRWMMLATAWQESCWRQFLKLGEKIHPVVSPAGALGLMQINPRAWRGFYDVQGLRGDISYNARAGSEILLHYLRDHAVAKGEHRTGKFDNVARATYAVYNGGPGHLTRYRKAKTRKALREIDASFWRKYQKVKAGDEMAVAECFGY